MTNLLGIIHHLFLIKTHNGSKIGTSSIYWAQKICVFYLMTETDSSLRNTVCFNKKTEFVVLTKHHRHKSSEFSKLFGSLNFTLGRHV
jgi:hypothetical protein